MKIHSQPRDLMTGWVRSHFNFAFGRGFHAVISNLQRAAFGKSKMKPAELETNSEARFPRKGSCPTIRRLSGAGLKFISRGKKRDGSRSAARPGAEVGSKFSLVRDRRPEAVCCARNQGLASTRSKRKSNNLTTWERRRTWRRPLTVSGRSESAGQPGVSRGKAWAWRRR